MSETVIVEVIIIIITTNDDDGTVFIVTRTVLDALCILTH